MSSGSSKARARLAKDMKDRIAKDFSSAYRGHRIRTAEARGHATYGSAAFSCCIRYTNEPLLRPANPFWSFGSLALPHDLNRKVATKQSCLV